MVRELRCLAERTVVSSGADRRRFTPWGLAGGHHAAGAHACITSPDGSVREVPTKVMAELGQGDLFRVRGWGDPSSVRRRQCGARLRKVSERRAHTTYGQQLWAPQR